MYMNLTAIDRMGLPIRNLLIDIALQPNSFQFPPEKRGMQRELQRKVASINILPNTPNKFL